MNKILEQHLEPVAKRINFRSIALVYAICWTIAAVVCLGLLLANQFGNWYSDAILPLCCGAALLSSFVALAISIFRIRKSTRNYHWVAEQIEQKFPDLDSTLLTAVEQKPAHGTSYGFLQHEVIRNAVYHDIKNDWPRIVPNWQLLAAPLATAASLLFVGGVLVATFLLLKQPAVDPSISNFDNVSVAGSNYSFDVEPGTVEIEQGSSLLVLARFNGKTPPAAILKYSNEQGESFQIEMTKSLADPLFAARIPNVSQPLDYLVELETQRSDSYRASVFQFPQLRRADAKLQFPEFAQLEEKIVQDVRRVTAVEGTQLTLDFMLNKAVETAQLVARDESIIELRQSDIDPKNFSTTITLSESERYELHLTDVAGRKNRVPPRFTVTVVPNQQPKIKIIAPARDVQVSPLEELDSIAEVWDDFGILRVGISFMIPEQPAQSVTLIENVPGKQNTNVQHLFAFEELNAKPDQLLSYYFWAEDIGPDGKPRYVASDMYFAEVRPFEEIYRQGQQPNANQQRQQQQNQQGQQNAQQAQQLAELQKQIINATWKIIRRESLRDSLAETFTEDVKLIAESQASAIEQVDALAAQVNDPQSKAHADTVKSHMRRAVQQLTTAATDSDAKSLSAALSSEQSAYQALLRLRAREHQIVRQNQQQQQQRQPSQQNNRSQQQLQQMQLSEDENRYESQNLAQPEENPQQREDRQVLNRLRELARRQNDLNERIKELQSAIEQAEDQAQRKEIEKQLKRLQEEQQQILRDTEELSDRMNRPENQQRMNEENQQLEKARENARQASEALEQGQVTKAAAEGTRAQRELEELRDEFQNRAADEFNERLKQMQKNARELEQKQNEIANELDQLDRDESKKKKSLGEGDPRKQIDKQLQDQQDRLKKLKDSMRKTIEQAEPDQPLLAQELYDTFRRNQQSNPEKSIDNTRQSLSQGWIDDAKNEERKTNESITKLKEGIEKAAEDILGDEAEALRRANQKLEQVNRELENEINQNQPRQSRDQNAQQRNPDQPQPPTRDQSGKQPDNKKGDGKRDPDQPEAPARDQSGKDRDGKKGDGKQSGKRNPDQPEPPARDQSGKQPDGKKGDGKRNPDQPAAPARDQSGKNRDGKQRDGQPNSDQQPNNNQQPPNRPRSLTDNNQQRPGRNAPQLNRRSGDDRDIRPLTGEDFLQWSDRLRDVEEMVNDPDLRAEAARIRDRAKAIRKDFQRHSKEPNWDLVRLEVLNPLVQLRQRLREEIIRKTMKKSVVPLDRDPVPAEFKDAVERYYKQIGGGQ